MKLVLTEWRGQKLALLTELPDDVNYIDVYSFLSGSCVSYGQIDPGKAYDPEKGLLYNIQNASVRRTYYDPSASWCLYKYAIEELTVLGFLDKLPGMKGLKVAYPGNVGVIGINLKRKEPKDILQLLNK